MELAPQQEKQELPAILTPQELKPEIIHAATALFWALSTFVGEGAHGRTLF